VKENDGFSLSHVDIGHLGIKYGQSFHLVRKRWTYRRLRRIALNKHQVISVVMRPAANVCIFAEGRDVARVRLSSIHERAQD
jgi:hypothetical protein